MTTIMQHPLSAKHMATQIKTRPMPTPRQDCSDTRICLPETAASMHTSKV